MTTELIAYAANRYSQNGEDGILAEIARRLDIRAGWFVEFGAWDGKHLSNAYNLLENAGWQGVFIESDPARFRDLERTAAAFPKRLRILRARVDSEGENRLDNLLAGTDTPRDFDLLSIDIDGNDWHVWQSFRNYRPMIVVIEANSSMPPGVWQVHEAGRARGSSFSALLKLGRDKGYHLVCHTGNMLFVADELVDDLGLDPLDLERPERLFNYDKHARILKHNTLRSRCSRAFFRGREALAGIKRRVLAKKSVFGPWPSTPTVSIVMPTLNQGQYIEEALLSVLSQAGDFHLECIVMDGASGDATVQILESYAARVADSSFPLACRSASLQWRSESDRGQAHAVNKALDSVTGDIVGWVNSDDRLREGAVSAAVEALGRRADIGFVYGDCRYIDVEGRQVGYRRPPSRFSWRRFTRGLQQGLPQPAVFVRTQVARTVGDVDENLHYTLDQDWFTRMAKRFDSCYEPRIRTTALRHTSAKTQDPLSPAYCAERALVHGRHGGHAAFVSSFASTAVELARAGAQGIEESVNRLSAAVREANVRIAFPLRPADVAHARSRAIQLCALERVSSDRRGAWRLLRGSVRGCSARYASGPVLLTLAKLCLPRPLRRLFAGLRRTGPAG